MGEHDESEDGEIEYIHHSKEEKKGKKKKKKKRQNDNHHNKKKQNRMNRRNQRRNNDDHGMEEDEEDDDIQISSNKKRKCTELNNDNSPKRKRRKLNDEIVSVEDVLAWFEEIGYGQYVNRLKPRFEEDEVDGQALKLMDMNDLKSFGIDRFYDRKMIIKEIG